MWAFRTFESHLLTPPQLLLGPPRRVASSGAGLRLTVLQPQGTVSQLKTRCSRLPVRFLRAWPPLGQTERARKCVVCALLTYLVLEEERVLGHT